MFKFHLVERPGRPGARAAAGGGPGSVAQAGRHYFVVFRVCGSGAQVVTAPGTAGGATAAAGWGPGRDSDDFFVAVK